MTCVTPVMYGCSQSQLQFFHDVICAQLQNSRVPRPRGLGTRPLYELSFEAGLSVLDSV